MKYMIFIGLLIGFTSVAASASLSGPGGAVAHSENGSPQISTANKQLIKAYTSKVVAAYACRNILDGGNGEYHNAMTEAEDAFALATNDREKARMMIKTLDNRIENEDPGEQLQRQFDEVKADPAMRKKSCENLLSGSNQRALDARQRLSDINH